jgi:hypothetical protein
MTTTPAIDKDLKAQRLDAFVRIKSIQNDINTGMSHWYEDYRSLSLSALREEACIQGIAAASMRRGDLVDAMVGLRLAKRKYEIATLKATVDALVERIEHISQDRNDDSVRN